MRPRLIVPLLALLAAAALAGCGGGRETPVFSQAGGDGDGGSDAPAPAVRLGIPTIATKNTTRVAGSDPVADAAGVAEAVFPGPGPDAVALVDEKSWQTALAASVLMAAPVNAPILFSDGTSLPDATSQTLAALAPTGSAAAGGGQVIRVGDVAKPGKLRTTDIEGSGYLALSQAIDSFASAAAGQPSPSVIVVSDEAPAYAMPAAGLAAHTGAPILFAGRRTVPRQTMAALRSHGRPRIYVVGPPTVISKHVLHLLGKLGTVTRIAGKDPESNAIAVARFDDGAFGWGVTDPGHGIVFADAGRPLDAAAAAPLSASAQYGPLLLIGKPSVLPAADSSYLLDIQPGYDKDPVRGVYNHGWIVGDPSAIATSVQVRIDGLLQIVPVQTPGSTTSTTP